MPVPAAMRATPFQLPKRDTQHAVLFRKGCTTFVCAVASILMDGPHCHGYLETREVEPRMNRSDHRQLLSLRPWNGRHLQRQYILR